MYVEDVSFACARLTQTIEKFLLAQSLCCQYIQATETRDLRTTYYRPSPFPDENEQKRKKNTKYILMKHKKCRSRKDEKPTRNESKIKKNPN